MVKYLSLSISTCVSPLISIFLFQRPDIVNIFYYKIGIPDGASLGTISFFLVFVAK